MRKFASLILLVLIVAVLGMATESIIEDWAGYLPSSISNASPARVTFSGSGHGFSSIQAMALLTIDAANASDGDTFTIDTRTYTMKSLLTSCSAYDIKIGSDNLETTLNIYSAINLMSTRTQGAGKTWCAGTAAHSTSGASYWSTNILQIFYKTGGSSGNGKAVSATGSALTFSRSSMQMMWTYLVTGATGNWFPLNTQWYGNALAKDMTSSSTTMRLASCAVLDVPSDHSASVLINGEEMLVTATASVSNGCNVTVTRGANSTTAAAHSTGNQIGFNYRNSSHPSQTNYFYVCQYVDSTHCDLYTDTGTSNPIDTSTYGAFPGGVTFWRGNWANNGGAEPLVTAYLGSSGSFNQTFIPVTVGSQTMMQLTVPQATGCTGTLDLDACALGYLTSDTQGPGVGLSRKSSTVGLVVASNVGKWVITSCDYGGGGASPPCTAGLPDPAHQPKIGGIAYLGYMADSSIDSTPGSGFNRPFIITGVFSDAGCATPTTTDFTCITVDTTPYSLANGTYGATGGQVAEMDIATKQAPYVYLKNQIISGNYPYSAGSLRSAVKSGPLADNSSPYNRYRVNWMPGSFVPRRSDGGTNLSAAGEWRNINDLGSTFPFLSGYALFGVGLNHWYHYGGPKFYANDWSLWDIVAVPQHHVSAALSTINYPHDPTFNGSMEPQWTGAQAGQSPLHYFEAMNAWYNNYGPVEVQGADLSGTYLFDRPRFDTVAPGQPEEFAGNAYVTWTATREAAGNQGYEISFTTPRYVNATYDIKYSTSGSLLANGFSTGSTFCSTTSTGSGYETAWCEGPSIAKATSIWIGIRPTMPIQAVTGNGVSPIWLSTEHDSDPMFVTGDHVTVTGVGGNTNANQTNAVIADFQPRKFWWAGDPSFIYRDVTFSDGGGPHLVKAHQISHGMSTGDTAAIIQASGTVNGFYTITVVDADNVTLDGSDYTSLCPSGCGTGSMRQFVNGGLTSIVSDGGSGTPANAICTVTTSSAHGLTQGRKIAVRNTTESWLGQISDNVAGNGVPFFTVATVPTSTTLTFACPSVPALTYKTDYSNSALMVMESWAAFALSGTGNGNYTSGGAVVSTEDNTAFREIEFTPPSGVSVPIVTTSSLPNGTTGVAYSSTLSVTGGTPTYTWSQTSGTLPTGLSLNTSTGEISGTPAIAGTSSGLVFRATDSASQTGDSPSLSLTIDSPPPALSGPQSFGTIHTFGSIRTF